jgi:NAD(P)-dependent dehydrogenase (short-subunit alcohol dehydrogenase family)
MTSTDKELTAVVAGGGSGIGRGCALRLARLGYRVVLIGRDPAKLEPRPFKPTCAISTVWVS